MLHFQPVYSAPNRGTPWTRPWRPCTRRALAAHQDGQQQDDHKIDLAKQKAEALKAWVVEHCKPLPTDLTPTPNADGGLSMITMEPVQRGQVLVRIPLKLMITSATAATDPEYGRLISEGPLTEWQALVLALLCERAKGAASFWAPYIAQLPEQADHPLSWGPDKLTWLQGSPMLDALVGRQKQVVDDCEVLQLVGANQLPLAAHWAKQHKGDELITVASVTWAAATLLSRAFSMDISDDEAMEGDMSYFGSWSSATSLPGTPASGDVLAIVPWADTLSHSSEAGPESCLRFSPELRAASLCAHTHYEPGQEVFDSYGPGLCPSDLLLDYGFVDTANTNHRVEVDPLSIVSPASGRAKTLLAAMSKAYMGSGSSEEASVAAVESLVRLPVTPDGPDLTLLSWLRAALSSDADLIKAGWRIKAGPDDVELACRVMSRLTEPSSPVIETQVLQACVKHFKIRIAAYATTLEQDQREAAQTSTPRPRQAALLALASEKYALHHALSVCEGWLQKLADACPLDDLYVWQGEHGEDEEEEGEGEGWAEPSVVGRRHS